MIVFGWPSAALGAILLITGVVRRNAVWNVAGTAVSAGFLLYVSLNPSPFRWFGILAIGGNLLSALAVRKQAYALAGISIVPFFLVSLILAYAVLNQ